MGAESEGLEVAEVANGRRTRNPHGPRHSLSTSHSIISRSLRAHREDWQPFRSSGQHDDHILAKLRGEPVDGLASTQCGWRDQLFRAVLRTLNSEQAIVYETELSAL